MALDSNILYIYIYVSLSLSLSLSCISFVYIIYAQAYKAVSEVVAGTNLYVNHLAMASDKSRWRNPGS